MIKVIRTKDYDAMSQAAFEVMKKVVAANPHATLGLATGSSPIGLYKLMIKDHNENGTSYQGISTYNLDEYVGLPQNHSQSYWTFMHENLFNHIDIKPENVHIPTPKGDLQACCDAYNAQLLAHPCDIQLLGIGSDGHIGFNEPGTAFDSPVHIADLKETTIADNARFFENDPQLVPTKAMTMGIGNVMSAKKILLVASGANKAKVVKEMVYGPVTEDVPASILQKHQDVVVVVDEAAAALLK
jgi:glucosamine-6-phosphate deaminase